MASCALRRHGRGRGNAACSAAVLVLVLAGVRLGVGVCSTYDQSTIQFHPSGRLMQVEYAQQAVDNGRLVVGLKCADGVLLCALKSSDPSPLLARVDTELNPYTGTKMFSIDDHVHCTACGLGFDAAALVGECRNIAAAYSKVFGSSIPVQRLVTEICEQKQQSTQMGGLRPPGVSLIFAGVDSKGFHLFTTTPGGSFHSWRACAVGKGSVEVRQILQNEYNSNWSMAEAWAFMARIMAQRLSKEASSLSSKSRSKILSGQGAGEQNVTTGEESGAPSLGADEVELELATLTLVEGGETARQPSWHVYSPSEMRGLLLQRN